MRTKIYFLIFLGICLLTTMAYPAGTPAGTVISNYATGDYKDANGNPMPQVVSNTVTTVVAQIAGVDITPPTSAATLSANGSVIYTFAITNTGNGPDQFDLTQITTSPQGTNFTVEIYHDVNGNGVIDPGDAIVSSTGILAADASFNIIVKVSTGVTPDGTQALTTLQATSRFDNNVYDTASLTTSVSATKIDVTMTASNHNPKPGDVITYAICGTNTGTGTAYNVVIVANIPQYTTYVPGSIRVMNQPRTDAADADGSDYNVTNPGAVTIGWGDAPEGASGCVYFDVVVNADIPVGTPIQAEVTVYYENASGVPYPPIMANGPTALATVAQSYGVMLGADHTTTANPGDYVYYAVSLTNTGNGNDYYQLSYTATLGTWTFWLDANGNGQLDPGEPELTDNDGNGKPETPIVPRLGVIYLIAKSQVPAGTPDQTNIIFTMRATSTGDPTAYDEAVFRVIVTAPQLTLVKSVTPTGPQPPGTVLTYRIDVTNSGSGIATQVIITDAIPNNTTYVPNSLRVAGVPKTDAQDGDGARAVGTSVIFTIPQLGPGGSTYCTFQVKID